MALCSTPQEIIFAITEQLTVAQALSLARTCCHLYSATMPYWAACAVLRSSPDVVSFCHFMLSQGSHRPLFLRKVTLDTRLSLSSTEGELAMLATVLARAHGLTEFVCKCVGPYLAPGFLDTLTPHPNIRTVRFSGGGHLYEEGHHIMGTVTKFLANMKGRLQALFLGDLMPGFDYSVALQPHAGTLGTVSLQHALFSLDTALPPISAVCPGVHTLVVTDRACSVIDMLVHAFPATTTLEFSTYSSCADEDYGNLCNEWIGLDHLVCHVSLVHIRRLIRRVSLLVSPERLANGELDRALLLIENTNPTVLSVSPGMDLIRALPLVAARCKYLRVCGRADLPPRDARLACTRENALSAASNLHELQLVALSFESSARERGAQRLAAPRDGEDLLHTAMTIASSVPSLKYVGFEERWDRDMNMSMNMSMDSGSMSSWFKISRDCGSVRESGVELLSPSEGLSLGRQLLEMR